MAAKREQRAWKVSNLLSNVPPLRGLVLVANTVPTVSAVGYAVSSLAGLARRALRDEFED
jgi:hypothetical protein